MFISTSESTSIPRFAAPDHYRTDIDGLRAVAVLSVVLFHLSPTYLPGGYTGVDIFFVISGYLISGILFRGLATGRLDYFDFYARRIRRIFPALITVLIAVLGIGRVLLLADEYQLLGRNVVAGAAFLTNLSLYQDFEWYFRLGANPLIHLWSLGIEEQFYVVWPLFLLLLWRFTSARFGVILSVTAVSFLLNIIAAHSDPIGCFYLPWNRLWELSSGAALAYLKGFNIHQEQAAQSPIYKRIFSRLNVYASWRGPIGLTLLLVSIFLLEEGSAYPSWRGLVPCAGTILLISAGSNSWINRTVLSARPMVFVGLISYPLYLWHWPLLVFGHMEFGDRFTPPLSVCLMALTFVFAYSTYKYIETPIRHSRPFGSALVGLCTSMLACGALGFLAIVGTLPARSQPPNVVKLARAFTEDWLSSSHAIPGARKMRSAYWTVSLDGVVTVGNASRQVLYIGDSNMQQYYPRIEKILYDHPSNSRSAVFSVGSGCAPVVMELLRFNVPDALLDPCRKTIQRGIDYAHHQNVDRIVISANWLLYFGQDSLYGESTRTALNNLQALISELVKNGKHIYLVLNIPTGDKLDPRKMIKRTLLPSGFAVETHPLLRSEIKDAVGPIDNALRRIAESTGAVVIDPLDFLCNDPTCPAASATGEPMYKDGGHLRPSYVRDNVRFLDETALDPQPSSIAMNITASKVATE